MKSRQEKKMDYKVLDSGDVDSLSVLVNKALRDGWELQGGVSVSLTETHNYSYVIFAQAIVKKGYEMDMDDLPSSDYTEERGVVQ